MKATAIRERGIIFRARSVRAILAGEKTQTRRVMKPQPTIRHGYVTFWNEASRHLMNQSFGEPTGEFKCIATHFSPYGFARERLWVREWFYIDHIDHLIGSLPAERPDDIDDIYFRADGECCDQIPECCCGEVGKPKWRSPLYMPRWASRITLEITGVKVERVQDISEADAIAEGCRSHYCSPEDTASCKPGSPERKLAEILEGGFLTAKNDFIQRWHDINGHRKGCAWKDNPWVWAITFREVKPLNPPPPSPRGEKGKG